MKPGWKWRAERQSPRSAVASALRSRRLGELGIGASHRTVTGSDKHAVARPAGSYQVDRATELLAAQRRAEYASQSLAAPGSPARHDAEREQRRQILRRVRGMWKDRIDAPHDGLRYQEEARAEWDR
jgi:hypothetical protein